MRAHLPSPAMMVALIALLVALGGTAFAAGVPLAKRALVADNAKKLGGKTRAQVTQTPGPATTLAGKTAGEIAAMPGPASDAAGLVVYKTSTRTLAPGDIVDVSMPCDQGQKAIGGGFQGPDDNVMVTFDTRPSADGTAWKLRLGSFELENATATFVAVCLK